MAYKPYDLSVLAYANGFTLWHYTTTDDAATSDTVGYFNKAADMLRVGDIIIANVDTDGTPSSGFFRVRSNLGGVVDIANLMPTETSNNN